MNYKNVVEYTGTLIKRRSLSDHLDKLTVVSKNGRDTYVSFICSKDKITNEIYSNQRLRVKIKAHLEGRKEYRNGAPSYMQRCVVDEISATNTMLEDAFGVKGKFYTPPHGIAYIAGELTKIEKSDDWYRYTIKVVNPDDNGHFSSIKLSHRVIDRMPELEEGDNVCTVCLFSTPKNVVGEHVTSYENLIVSDIAKY